MTKQELEQTVERLQQVNTEHYQKIVALESQIVRQQQAFLKYQEDIEEKMYQEWVKQNGKFIERFFTELVKKHLSIETVCDYGGYVETILRYDDESVSTSSDTVISQRNSLDE